MKLWSSSWRRWARAIHRDLGYFFIGACAVYGVSGFVLSMRSFGVDFANDRVPVLVQLPAGVPADSILLVWERYRGEFPAARSVRAGKGENVRLIAPGARLEYRPRDGQVFGELVKSRWGLSLLNRLHYNRKGAWEWIGAFFGVGLVLLAVTGAVLLRGRQGFWRRGVWFMLAGLVVMVLAALL